MPPPAQAQVIDRRGPNDADFILRNGPVFTANTRAPWAKAVAVRDGVITYVGEIAGVDAFVGPATRVIDLAGKLLLPGFVEGHIHPIVGATLTHGVDLQYDTREETLKALGTWRDNNGSLEVVRGFGWRYSTFGPEGPVKADLDALWPDTPVILLSNDTHAAWVNSKALKIAGIVPSAPDPMPGYSFFRRDAKTGEPTGCVVEIPAVLQIMQAAAPITADFVATALEEWLPKAAAAGITSLFEAGIQIMADRDGLALYEAIERGKRLPCRIVACHYHNNPQEDPMPAVRRLRDRARTALVSAGVLKLVLDGEDSQYTAAMLEPYSDRPATRGVTLLNAALTRDTVMRADAEGFDVHFHAIGDRAVRLALDAIDAAIRSNGARDRRHTIAHCSAVSDDDLKRFADLGVIAQMSAQWAVPDLYWEKVTSVRWGPERAGKLFRMGSLLQAGAEVSLGTDWPASPHRATFRPLDAIETAVTRRELGKADQTPLPPDDEHLTLEQAVRANTIAPARQLRLDDKVGSIAIGKRADLVLLDRNIFEAPAHQIHDAEVMITMMNGVVRYEKNAALPLPALPK